SYRLSSYFLSKQLAELPLILFNPTIFTIVVYWASGLLPDFSRFIAHLMVTLLGTLTAQSFGYFFGATLLNVQKSICKYQHFYSVYFKVVITNLLSFYFLNIAVSLIFMLSTMLLGGFYVKNLPSGL